MLNICVIIAIHEAEKLRKAQRAKSVGGGNPLVVGGREGECVAKPTNSSFTQFSAHLCSPISVCVSLLTGSDEEQGFFPSLVGSLV